MRPWPLWTRCPSLFMYGIGIRIYPDTGLFETALREGLVAGREELLFPTFYVSKELDVAWAKRFIDRRARTYGLRKAGMLPVMASLALSRLGAMRR